MTIRSNNGKINMRNAANEVKYENKIQIYKYTRACVGVNNVAQFLLYAFLDTTA